MVQVHLIQKFLDTLIEDAARIPMGNMFKQFEEAPLITTKAGIEHCIHFYLRNSDPEIKSAAVNGIIAGVFMSRISEDPHLKEFFEKNIELYKRSMGENVHNFYQEKIERRK